MYHRILCLLFFQWIYALFTKFSSKKCDTIYPAKFITNNQKNFSANLIIHGNRINTSMYISANIWSEKFNKLNEDYTKKLEYNARKKAKKEKKSQKRLNTTILSTWIIAIII